MEPLETVLTKEIEQLRADKVALMEMLERTKEFLGDEQTFHTIEAFRERIADLLKCVG
jgi:hypothetical protein